jgi:sugar/nucleoside kinase (ribokinase family)
MRLIQLSGVVVDHVYRVDAVPAPGTEAVVHSAWLAAAGGFNAMVAARRMGMAVAYGGTLGTGPFADLAARAMETEGITLLRPRLPDQDQGCCTVIVDRTGERSFLYLPGADGVVSPADLAMIPQDEWLLLSGYGLEYPHAMPALTDWLGAARGQRLVFDPCTVIDRLAPEARQAALGAALWITANRAEAGHLTGCSDPEAAAATLAAGRPAGGGAVVRDGANGAFLAMPQGPVRYLPGHPVNAIDTNGAGDTHTGVLIAMLAQGNDPALAVAIANVAAALSTTREGPATAPLLADVLAALGRSSA